MLKHVSNMKLGFCCCTQGGRTGLEGEGLTIAQRSLYGLGVVLLRYLWCRTDQLAANQHWGDAPPRTWPRVLWRGMRWAENGFKVASLLNFLLFLRFGKYRCAEPDSPPVPALWHVQVR